MEKKTIEGIWGPLETVIVEGHRASAHLALVSIVVRVGEDTHAERLALSRAGLLELAEAARLAAAELSE